VRLFLDSSVLLAASGSDGGASREIFRRATECNWLLITSPYVVEEVLVNLPNLPAAATADWARLRFNLVVMDNVLTLDRPAVGEHTKDRPILFTALAWSDVLLTLHKTDFGTLLGGTFYGLPILTPGMFLDRERAAGRLRNDF
jgi:predicted nucleic acid-binding protein